VICLPVARTVDCSFYVGNLLVPAFDFNLVEIKTIGLQLLLPFCRTRLATPAAITIRPIWRPRSADAQAGTMLACPTDGSDSTDTLGRRNGICLSK
jgi:hypothetical protein